MRLVFDLPTDGRRVSVVARFSSPAQRRSMVFVVELLTATGTVFRSPGLAWSEKFLSNFVYCPEMQNPGFRSLTTFDIDDGVTKIAISVEPWQSLPSVVGSVDGVHLCVSLRGSELVTTCAGVPA